MSFLPKIRMVVEKWVRMSPLGAPVSVSAASGSHVTDVQDHGILQVTEHLEVVRINLVKNFQFILG